MPFPSKAEVDALKREWTDQYVRVKPGRDDLTRYADKTGRVVTVSYSGRAVVDFADGPWIDVADFASALEIVSDAGNYDASANSAQKLPVRQS